MSEGWEKYWSDEANLERWRRPAVEVVDFLKALGPSAGRTVLDLGCGLGRHAVLFAQAGFEVTATDASATAIKRLDELVAKRSLSIRTAVCDVFGRGFAAESFDVVVSYNVIYHAKREGLAAAIEYVRGLLEPGGRFFCTCASRDDGKYGFGEEVAPHTFLAEKSINPGEIHYFASEADLREMLSRFEILSLDRQEYWWEPRGEKQFHSYWLVIVKKMLE